MRILEPALWLAGVLLVTGYIGAQAWGERERGQAVSAFTAAQAELLPARVAPNPQGPDASAPGVMTEPSVVPVAAVLRIDRIALEVPIGYGTEESVLRRGAGLIEGTARPGQLGNVGIAAHRDTFFRSLQHLVPGDLIVVDTLRDTQTYRVTELSVVEPEDVHVLHDNGTSMLTLVTCYPFYFIGNAPQRFIVHAVSNNTSI